MSRTLVSFKDVAIAYFTDGVGGVQAMENPPANATLKAALKHIREETDGQNMAWDLEAYVAEAIGGDNIKDNLDAESSTPKTRGRPVPTPGDTRGYKVQQNGDEIPWIRVPLCTVPCTPGEEVQVAFGDGTVSVTA